MKPSDAFTTGSAEVRGARAAGAAAGRARTSFAESQNFGSLVTNVGPTALVSRRQFLCAVGATGLLIRMRPADRAVSRSSDDFDHTSAFASFDREIEQFMQTRRIPGGALAVVKEGRLVYARGYGFADREGRELVWPTSRFRIASISKPITAVAVLKLVEEKKLNLEAPVLDWLDIEPAKGKPTDARWSRIAIHHLLQHIAGWDRDKSFDPMFHSRQIAGALGVPSPPGPHDIIRYMLGRPLDFNPGARYAYSNFGYCILGRILEKVTGLGYERFVQQHVLAPIGIRRMRIGHSLADKRTDGEVRYYMPDNEMAVSVFDDSVLKPIGRGVHAAGVLGATVRRTPEGLRGSAPGTRARPLTAVARNSDARKTGVVEVPWPYGGFCLEAMDAHGGWTAPVIDLARFAAAFHDPNRCPLLKPATIRMMYAPPPPPVWRDANGALTDHYYACGWLVRPVKGGKASYWHTGSLPGTYALLVRRWDGLSWAVLFNQRSVDNNLPNSAIDTALHRAANAVREWPDHDLFSKYR